MSDASDPPLHLSIVYSDDEVAAIRKLLAARYARGQDSGTFWWMLMLSPVAIGLAVLAAFELGLVELPALKPVLFTAFAAFAAGAATYWFAIHQYFRTYYSNTARSAGPWEYSFDEAGIRYNNEDMEARVSWRAVEAVEDLGWIVLFRCGERALAIPSRMFPDAAARANFVALVAAHIKAAAMTKGRPEQTYVG